MGSGAPTCRRSRGFDPIAAVSLSRLWKGRSSRDRGRGARGRVDRGDGGRVHRTRVTVAEGVLDANETIARANRGDFDRHGVSVINLMSAPGAGKTTLLERALEEQDDLRVGVLEGDVQGTLDAD